jgi:hypothetical protein
MERQPRPEEIAKKFLADCHDNTAYAASLLFRAIMEQEGEAEAWRIFGKFKPPKGDRLALIKNCALLDMYDLLHEGATG